MLLLFQTVPSRTFKVFTGNEEENLKLGQTPDLLSFAALTGEAVTIPVNEPSQTGIVQERVFVTMDCLPWLNRFPGGTIQWSRVVRYINGNIRESHIHAAVYKVFNCHLL